MDHRIDIHNVLADIRALRSQMNQAQQIRPEPISRPEEIRGLHEPGRVGAPGFGEMLETALDHVNGLQKESGTLREAWVKGDEDVDLAQVMIASEKASVSFQALTQVRNKVVQAYEDIMKMPI